MLGGYAVGKTSLVRRFVHSLFSEKYQTTIGVKIDKKTVVINNNAVDLLLWDIGGEEDAFAIPASYMNGAAGYLLVIDGTRRESLDQARDIQKRTRLAVGDIPFIALLNKSDLTGQWDLVEGDLDEMRKNNWVIMQSSAKDGGGVEEAFHAITQSVLSSP